jgi:hypothetical protein
MVALGFEGSTVASTLRREILCPRRAVEAVLEATRILLGSKARVFLYQGDTPLPTLVIVLPKGVRRSWVSYAITRYAEERGVDVYSFIDVVVLREQDFHVLFPASRRSKLKPLNSPEDLDCKVER